MHCCWLTPVAPCHPCPFAPSLQQAAPDATGLGCHVSVHVAVPFSKRCMVKGLIMGATLKDCQVRLQTVLGQWVRCCPGLGILRTAWFVGHMLAEKRAMRVDACWV